MTLQLRKWEWTQRLPPNWKIESYGLVLPVENTAKVIHIGIDPGTAKIGIAIIFPHGETSWLAENGQARTYEVTVERDSDPVKRITEVAHILGYFLYYFTVPTYAVIEGSAFSKLYRQSELAEFRAATVLWCQSRGIIPRIMDIRTIRKSVFGSGKIRAEDQWPELPGDAASALACAICSMKMEREE